MGKRPQGEAILIPVASCLVPVFEWCEEGDLNPYAISGTSPSN